MQSKTIRIGIVVGLVVALILVIVAGLQFRKATAADLQTSLIRSQITEIQKRITDNKGQRLVKESTETASPKEEANFISQLKTMAKDSKVVIAKWSVMGATMNDNIDKGKKPDPNQENLLNGVAPIAGELVVEGDYRDVLRFTGRLLAAPRLYNLGFIFMSRNEFRTGTRLGMVLTRYVEVPTTAIQEGQKV